MHGILWHSGQHQGGVVGVVVIVLMLGLRASRMYYRSRGRGRRPGGRGRFGPFL